MYVYPFHACNLAGAKVIHFDRNDILTIRLIGIDKEILQRNTYRCVLVHMSYSFQTVKRPAPKSLPVNFVSSALCRIVEH